MKKLIVLLLALSVVGIAVMAQDAAAAPAPTLKLSGYLDTGLTYAKVGSADDAVAQWGNDSATNGRFQINGSYTNGDYGVNFRLRVQPSNGFSASSSPNAVFLRRGYGWTNLFGGMAMIQAGKLGDYTWSGANGNYWNSFGNFDGPVGIQLQIKPIDGLNFGIFVPVAQTSAPMTLSDTFGSSALGLNYTMKDTFNVQFGYQMMPDTKAGADTTSSSLYLAAGGELSSATVAYYDGAGVLVPGPLVANTVYTKVVTTAGAVATKNNSSLWFGGQILAVPKLTLDFEGQVSALGASDKGSFFVFENVAYDLAPLNVSMQMSQEMFNASSDKAQLEFNPTVDYALSDSINAGVTGDIAMKDSKTGYDFGPYAKFVTNKNSFVKIGVSYAAGDYTVGDGLVVFYTPGDWTPISDSITSAYLDFVWNF